MKSNAIEISLQAILDKLNILPRKEDVMQSKSDFRKLESEDGLGDSQRKADEGMASMLAKSSQQFQQTSMATERKDMHSSIHVASTSQLSETSFQLTSLGSTGYSPSSNWTELPVLQTRYSSPKARAKDTTSEIGKHLKRPSLISSA